MQSAQNGKILVRILLWLLLAIQSYILAAYVNISVTAIAIDCAMMLFIVYFSVEIAKWFVKQFPTIPIYLLCLSISMGSSIVLNVLYFYIVKFNYTIPEAVDYYTMSVGYKIILHFILITCCSYIEISSEHIGESIEQQEKESNNVQLKKDAELFKLRQQINPHFLFNALNSINALVTINSDKARQMILQLSNYFRSNLKKEDHQMLSIKEELEDINLYLNIETVRFGHRLTIEKSIEESLLDYPMPPFLLQPLVENAIKYGLYNTTGKITITIKLFKTQNKEGDDFATFELSNPYEKDGAIEGTGFGIASVKRRLYLIYERNDLIFSTYKKISDTQDLFKIYLSIPL